MPSETFPLATDNKMAPLPFSQAWINKIQIELVNYFVYAPNNHNITWIKVNDKHCFFCDSVPFGNCEELSWFPLHPEFQ